MLFKTDRFGMFIHFGIYSGAGWHEQQQLRMNVPKSEYIKLKDIFNPKDFDADETVKFAKDSGAQYICFTTKHHDGFCMWDTKFTDYNIMNTPYGKDILKELADACEKYEIKLELYYSMPDWHYKHSVNDGSEAHKLKNPNPGDEPNEDLYIEYIKNQVEELLTNYGKIHALFWDIPPKRREPSVNEFVRKLQPDILINDRGYDKGDYSTPEREACIKNANFDRLCEACQSVGSQSWGYREDEDYFTSQFLIASMSSILIKGGNFLLNVGPDGTGKIPDISKEIFKEAAEWYKRIYESIIDTEFICVGKHQFTRRGNTVYLHLPSSYGCAGVRLAPFTVAPVSAVLLNGGEKADAVVEYTPLDYDGVNNTAHLHIKNIPAKKYMGENMVIKMEFEDADEFFSICDTDKNVVTVL